MLRSAPIALVVEDIPIAREMACEMLRSLGFKCYDAYNGADALHILSVRPEVDVLFADVRMPGISGIELAQEARRIRPHLKVILTSGWVGADAVPEDLAFVPKPIRLDRLRRVVGQAGVVGKAGPQTTADRQL